MLSPTNIAAALQVVGTVLTLLAIVLTVVVSRRELADARARAAAMRELAAENDADGMAQIERAKEIAKETGEPFGVVIDRLFKESAERLRPKYEAHDIVMPTMGNMTQLTLMESERFASRLLASNRVNAVLVGAGLLLASVGSVWSMYL